MKENNVNNANDVKEKKVDKSIKDKGVNRIQKNDIKKEIKNFRIEDKSAALIMQDFYSMLYGFIAQRVIDSFGAEGEQIIRRAIRDYSIARGKKLREKHLELGLEPNLVNLMTYYDLPTDDEQDSEREEFEPDNFFSCVSECVIFDKWQEYGHNEAGILYCEELHHAMWSAYDPDIVVVQEKIKTRGDDECSFKLTMPNYKCKKKCSKK